MAIYKGDNSKNIIFGSDNADYIYGFGSDDKLFGLRGDDVIYGGDGNDILEGGDGNNKLYGGNGNDILMSGVFGSDTVYGDEGNDVLNDASYAGFTNSTLIGGNGKDTIIGGFGKDKIILTESTAATDKVIINPGDSKRYDFLTGENNNSFDTITGFSLGNGVTRTGVDKLDLSITTIATKTTGVDGINVGVIRSHVITNGIISFDDSNTFSSALSLTGNNLASVFTYLENNFADKSTVAFIALGNTYVFQGDGTTDDFFHNDTLIQFTGITATNLNTNGLSAGGIWLV